ncbi:hypothetical protein CPB84DRAFT_1749087 [Gymnopilus junonius]|uniref:Uncharacterized protein n=1 Tax=Gymnopilus junonius TaxID=109634 RepID=A0A9P5TLR5_GYMJU|nr:hypothetical protein CPB84DRAFT_1749087 [Gymnopilus junonius]
MAQAFPDDTPSQPPHASPPIIRVSEAPTATPTDSIDRQLIDDKSLSPHREAPALPLPNSGGVVNSRASSRPRGPPKWNLRTLLDPYDGKSPYAFPVDELPGLTKSPSQESVNTLRIIRRDQIRQNDHLSTAWNGRSSTASMIPDKDRSTVAGPASRSVDNLPLRKKKNFFSSAKHCLVDILTPSAKIQPNRVATADHAYNGHLPAQHKNTNIASSSSRLHSGSRRVHLKTDWEGFDEVTREASIRARAISEIWAYEQAEDEETRDKEPEVERWPKSGISGQANRSTRW